ncbi:UNVERIFIED_CONTAM: hypothetical protein K2H54_051773 [Gekko kuhli]
MEHPLFGIFLSAGGASWARRRGPAGLEARNTSIADSSGGALAGCALVLVDWKTFASSKPVLLDVVLAVRAERTRCAAADYAPPVGSPLPFDPPKRTENENGEWSFQETRKCYRGKLQMRAGSHLVVDLKHNIKKIKSGGICSLQKLDIGQSCTGLVSAPMGVGVSEWVFAC